MRLFWPYCCERIGVTFSWSSDLCLLFLGAASVVTEWAMRQGDFLVCRDVEDLAALVTFNFHGAKHTASLGPDQSKVGEPFKVPG